MTDKNAHAKRDPLLDYNTVVAFSAGGGKSFFAPDLAISTAAPATLESLLDQRIPNRVVQFDAYPDDVDPLVMIGQVAIQGDVVFRQPANHFFGNGHEYASAAVHNPTWLDVAVLCNEMLLDTANLHYVYLEGIDGTGEEQDGCPVYRFVMGS